MSVIRDDYKLSTGTQQLDWVSLRNFGCNVPVSCHVNALKLWKALRFFNLFIVLSRSPLDSCQHDTSYVHKQFYEMEVLNV